MTQPWTLLSLLTWTTKYFTEKNVESPRSSAEILLSYAVGISRLDLYVRFEQPVTPRELARFKEMIKRRVTGEPVAYITGQKGFWNLTLAVTPAVLIPRPETELVIETALSLFPDGAVDLQILDLGTGSGAIALALANEFKKAMVVAVDKSVGAIEIARKNAETADLKNQVTFIVSDWLVEIDANCQFDLIVSNPPYIPSADMETLQTEVREFEPRGALDGGADGFRDIFELLKKVPAYLVSGGFFLMETGWNQKQAIERFLKDQLDWQQVEFIKDYAGLHRIVKLQKK